MVDDVLRLRATVLSDEALANIRALGREIGLMPQKAAPHINQINAQFTTLCGSVKQLGRELQSMIPAMSGIGLGAAGAGIAASYLMRSLSDMSKRVVELKYASKELGMSERDIRAWSNAAEKAGVSTQSMMQGLEGFKKTTDGLKFNIGGARDELYALGAGPIVQRMQAATTQADKLKVAFNFKDQLMKDDPSGFKARAFFDQIGLGADKARLSYEAYAKSSVKALSPEDQAAAEKFNSSLIDLGESWDHLKTKAGIALFPVLAQDIKDLEALAGALEKAGTLIGEVFTGKGSVLPPAQQRGPQNPAESLAMGYKPIAFHPGGGGGGGGELGEGSRMVKDGVFAALVDFQSYVQGGAAAGGGGGGIQKVGFGGSAGAAAGGGGAGSFGGGGYTNLTPGTGGGSAGGGGGSSIGERAVGPAGGAGGGSTDGVTPRAGTPGQGPMTLKKGDDPRGLEQHIREAAKANGVDPDTAVRVAKSEGLRDFLGDKGKSGGAFQLYTGGGLGNEFKKETGLDPLDPKNEKATIDWAMKKVPKTGWTPWHGAAKVGVGAREGLPGGTPPNGQKPADAGGGGDGSLPPRVSAVGGGDPAAFITHHTGGRGTVAGVQNTLKQRGLGVQYVMDRDGNIVQTGGPGAAHMRPGSGAGAGLSNKNVVGMEIIAKDDKDVTATQSAAYAKFMAARYPDTPIFGHGQVNPGHKEATEGLTAKYAAEEYRRTAAATNRIDQAVDNNAAGGANVNGSVKVDITSNGTAASAKTKTDGPLWQQSTVQNYKQMQPTSKPVSASIDGTQG